MEKLRRFNYRMANALVQMQVPNLKLDIKLKALFIRLKKREGREI